MEYTILIDCPVTQPPFRDVIDFASLSEARQHALGLLSARPTAVAARLYLGDYYRETIAPDLDLGLRPAVPSAEL